MFIWLLRLFSRSWNVGSVTVIQGRLLIDQTAVKDHLTGYLGKKVEFKEPLIIRFHGGPFLSPRGGKLTLEVKRFTNWFFRRYQIDITITHDYIEQLQVGLRWLKNDRPGS